MTKTRVLAIRGDGERISLADSYSMNRRLTFILVIVLSASVIWGYACSGSDAPHSRSEVLSSFSKIAEQRTLSGRENIYSWWSERLNQGNVRYVEAEGYYEVEFVSMSGVEEWGIDMESSEISPLNDRAVMSAFTMFCSSKDDPSADCQQWADQL